MCGIVGYIGDKSAAPFLLDGLTKLEYRGYDSAGIAVYNDDNVFIEKSVGRLSSLKEKLRGRMPEGTVGIGHTRWATHGRPSDQNAHPHTDCHGEFIIVHNGIIENYMSLKEDLIAKGHKFTSEMRLWLILLRKFIHYIKAILLVRYAMSSNELRVLTLWFSCLKNILKN